MGVSKKAEIMYMKTLPFIRLEGKSLQRNTEKNEIVVNKSHSKEKK